ncbi:MAG: DsrE family protein [Kangiellaceae bacterium]|nr:DsrE family protein [Kangiellaceae bacterium]
MTKTFIRALVLTSFIFLTQVAALSAGNKSVKGPVFSKYGPVFPIKNSDITLPENHTYKVVFDITKTSENEFQLNRRLESVARFINMHVMNGVKLENLDLAVVIHGAATRDGLNQKAYQERYFDSNPSLEMIEQLDAKGVKFYQCGQSIEFMGIKKIELSPQINLALSAMTMLAILQSDGFSLVPL